MKEKGKFRTIETKALWKFFTVDLEYIWDILFCGSLASKTEKAENRLVYGIVDELRDHVLRFIRNSYPITVINEEGVSNWQPETNFCSLDLIDGTKSLLLGMPLFGVQYAIIVNSIIEEVVIFLPTENKLAGSGLYIAKRGAGAFFVINENVKVPLHVSNVRQLSKATVAFDGPSDDVTKLYRHPLASKIPLIRNFSSFCWAGTRLVRGNHIPLSIDAVIGINNKPWDHIPTILLVEEAGGIITDHLGNPYSLSNYSDIIFSNGHLHKHIIQYLQSDPIF